MLEALLQPKVVAVLGASRSPGKVGHEVVSNLIKSGFKGAIVPINPSSKEILGLPCYASPADFGKPIDLGIIVVPTALVRASVDSLIACDAKAIVIITAGFKEIGAAGKALEVEIANICKSHGVRLLGPNCLGLINMNHNMNASFAKKMPGNGGISFISQSGALCSAILDWAADRHLGMSHLISMGNKADLCETDFIEAYSEDPKTRVIVGYLESIASGDEFIKIAEAAALKKPIVIFKSGVTSAGMKAASSHTGSLAGADIAYGAAFKRSGVIRAETFEAMFDYATAFAMQPLPASNRVAIITNAGGPGIMAADAVEQSGMKIGALAPDAAAALRKKLPLAASVGNPIDVLGDADPARYAAAVESALNDPSIDAIIVILTPQAVTQPLETARAIAKCTASSKKPVMVSFMGGEDVMPGRHELVKCNLPDYPSPERAVAALKAMCDYVEWLRRPARVVTRFPVNRRRAGRLIARQIRMKQFQVGEAYAKSILKSYGFTISNGGVAANAHEAVELADHIGYPVAMKILSPDIIHKSDIGGVKLNLGSPEQVRDAFDLMMLRISERMPRAFIDGVYLEKMCQRGREVILGMVRDPQFGPMLMFGLGGIFVEVMKDVTFHIAPITELEARQMLESTKSYALLKGTRGQASVDLGAIATALQRISQLVSDYPQIKEMDINPFIVGQVGGESIAADARITLSRNEEPS